MLPSRSKALAGVNYEPADKKEYEEMQNEQTKKMNAEVEVELFTMISRKITQLQITYKGEKAILCVSEKAPNDLEVLVNTVRTFYNYIDLSKTALLKKASTNGKSKISMSTTIEKTHEQRKIWGGHNKSGVDIGLTVLSNDIKYKFPIYRERVIQIFTYAKKRLNDESIPKEQRLIFDTSDVYNNVYLDIYKYDRSQLTARNKLLSTLNYMVDQNWLEYMGKGNRSPRRYKMIENPYESEMPAQAEPIDTDYLKESKAKALQLYREK